MIKDGNIGSTVILLVVVVLLVGVMGIASTVSDGTLTIISGQPTQSIASSLQNSFNTNQQSAVSSRWGSFSPCRFFPNDIFPRSNLGYKCTAGSSLTRSIRIINDLDQVERDQTYFNEVIRVLLYRDSTSVSITATGSDAFHQLVAAGNERLTPTEDAAGYHHGLQPGEEAVFTIPSSIASGSGMWTYDIGLMIGYFDSSLGSAETHIQQAINCDSTSKNKFRFLRVNHPAGKKVTIRMSGLFADYSFLEEGWCSSSSGSSSGLVGSWPPS